jgi:hypothetical protein
VITIKPATPLWSQIKLLGVPDSDNLSVAWTLFTLTQRKKESNQIIDKAKKIYQDSVVIDFPQSILVYFAY